MSQFKVTFLPEKQRKELVGQNRTEQCCFRLDLSTETLNRGQAAMSSRGQIRSTNSENWK
jgi:hypothetical protein